MNYKREYRRARWKLRRITQHWTNDGVEFIDLSKHPAVVCMEMKLRGLDRTIRFHEIYTAWHNVLRALENLHRHTSTK